MPSTVNVHGKELQGFLYECPFDQRFTNHILEILLSVARFGGQGFAKTAGTTAIKKTHHAGLLQRVEAGTYYVLALLFFLVEPHPFLSWYH